MNIGGSDRIWRSRLAAGLTFAIATSTLVALIRLIAGLSPAWEPHWINGLFFVLLIALWTGFLKVAKDREP